MRLWFQALKRSLLALAAVVIAFAWSDTGYTQAPCNISRGQDPLDVLNSGLRHNVWLVLDTSGSMLNPPSTGGASKIQQAKDALNLVMDQLVDGAGRPLVNWGFVHYGVNAASTARCPAPLIPPDANSDLFPDSPGSCAGLNLSSFVNPGTCAQDSRPDVRAKLNAAQARGTTPIGIAFSQIGSYLVGDGTVNGNRTNFVQDLLPNQKNFIIHITDGEDTCECDAGGYPANGTGPLVNTVTMRPDPTNPNATASSTGNAQDYSAFNAGLKGEFVLKSIDPALDGSKGNLFTIGFDLGSDPNAQRRVGTIAWMAAGANLVPQRDRDLMFGPFFADKQDKLVTDLRNILARIGIPEREVTLGGPIIGSVKEVVASHTNRNVNREDLIPLDLTDENAIREARIVRADHRDNVLFGTSVEVPGFRGHLRATNIYRVTDPDLPRTAREADFTEIWDAGVELQDDNPDARQLFFNRRNSTALLPFDTGNVTPADLGVAAGYLRAATDEDARDIVVQVMRGYRLILDPDTKSPYDSSGQLNFSRLDADGEPTWKLYETTGSVAVVLSPPRSPDLDPPLNHAEDFGVGATSAGDDSCTGGRQCFYWDHFNRKTLVLYPSNAGILHAFDAETGAESFGYIPDDAMSLDPAERPGTRDTIKDYVELVVTENNNILNHRFTLSISPNVSDAFLRSDHGGDDEWHTLVAFGRGRGGRFLTMLDFTDADTPGGLRLLWNRGNREGINDGLVDGLGETWSIPVFGNVDTRPATGPPGNDIDQWLVFLGGGYGCANSTEGEYLFAFRVEDGFLYHRAEVTPVDGAVIPKNGVVANPTLYIPHFEDPLDNRDFVTRVYIPDLHGQIWKLNTIERDPADWTMNVFAEMGPEHPITTAVTLMEDVFSPNRIFIMAGSGGDRRAPVPNEGFKFRAWEDLDTDSENTTQFTAASTPEFEQFFNFEERMFVPAVTAGKIGDTLEPVVFFAASREDFDTDTCEITFTSTLYALGIVGGLPLFDLDSSTAGDNEQVSLGETKVQGMQVRDGNVYLEPTEGGVSVWGDNSFDDDPAPAGVGQFTLQLLVEGFRLSPF
jgi:hypothetical protein